MEKPPKEPNLENIDKDIESLLQRLSSYAEYYDKFPDLEERWYYIEMEAKAGKDREQAKARLEDFISSLEGRIKEDEG